MVQDASKVTFRGLEVTFGHFGSLSWFIPRSDSFGGTCTPCSSTCVHMCAHVYTQRVFIRRPLLDAAHLGVLQGTDVYTWVYMCPKWSKVTFWGTPNRSKRSLWVTSWSQIMIWVHLACLTDYGQIWSDLTGNGRSVKTDVSGRTVSS